MKIKLLALIFLGIFCSEAQTTHDLNWDTGVGTSLDLNIDVGDTVRWTWTDVLTHSVLSSVCTKTQNPLFINRLLLKT